MTEEERVSAVRRLMSLDAEPEELFEFIARMASEACGTGIALLTIVDEGRAWFAANIGLPKLSEVAKEHAFCARAIESDGVFEIPDAALDPRFADSPLVAGPEAIRFYAGAPVVSEDGARVGALCVLERRPMELDADRRARLAGLAALASAALRMRAKLVVKAVGARTEAEALLSRSERRHRELVEARSELACLCEADGSIVYASRAFAAHAGSSPENLVGGSFFGHVAPADRASAQALFQGVARDGAQRALDARMDSGLDGAQRWVSWRFGVQSDGAGRDLLRAVGRDVTERVGREGELRESERLLARAARLSGVGSWELDPRSGRVVWSQHMRRIHEVDDGFEPTAESALAFFAPEGQAKLRAAAEDGIASGRPWQVELPMTTAKGKEAWVRLIGEAEFERGALARVAGALVDITQRMRLADRLDESERFARLATDAVPTRIAYIGRDLRFRFANAAYCARFGRERSEVVGSTRADLTGKPYDECAQRMITAVLGGEPRSFETWEDVGGSRRLVTFSMVPDLAPDGSARGFFSAATDITERVAAEQASRDVTAILENTPDLVIQTDRRGRIAYLNPAARRIWGVRPGEDVAGSGCSELHAGDGLFSDAIAAAVEASGAWMGESAVVGADGQSTPVSHIVIGHRGEDGLVERYSAVMRDISGAAEARRALATRTDTLRAVVEAIPAIVAVVGSDARVRVVNAAYERWTGVDRAQAIGAPMHGSLAALGSEAGGDWAALALQGVVGGIGGAARSRGEERHFSGTHSPLVGRDGEVDGFIVVAQDVTERRRTEVGLLRLARLDPLTGLLNRGGFEAEAGRLIDEAGPGVLALLCVDLDGFKAVNDAHGHLRGDDVLREFAQRLRRLVRPTDPVARLGGDEFAVLLAGIAAPCGAGLVAEKIVAAAAEPFQCQGLTLTVGASVGVAFKDGLERGWDGLFARADSKLYEAKGAGRGRHASQSWP